MPKANELKKGMIIDLDGIPHIIKQLSAKSPSSRGATTVYKVIFNNLQTNQKFESSYKGTDMLKEGDYRKVPVQFSYQDSDTYYFLNMDDFNQYGLNAAQLEEQIPYLIEQQEDIMALIMNESVLGIELPQSVTLVVTDTPPALAGASATNRNKVATLSTGLEVQVPEYLEVGETIKINTVTGKFMSRA